ncbi:hypothetical protein HSX10_13260 [Winogradskyella undariae]|uniref:hypothetical protein n=1 Tax=Winogradskyella undariae TaxID=1285465 RepID=UPI00156B8926|nr:hypothetical protein [Winogradskyella undariae]NRR92536.1 hypothetical protein [Winogradskyella undariae]
MKRFIFTVLILITLGCFNGLKAQSEFGIKGGVNLTFFNVEEGSFGSNQEVELGYYAGCFVDFEIENGFNLQTELLFIGLGDFKFLNAPIYLKYNFDEDFNILVGPSINYFLNFFYTKLKVRADLAFAYNLTSKLDLHMKYTIGFEEISPNVLFLGLGYKL